MKLLKVFIYHKFSLFVSYIYVKIRFLIYNKTNTFILGWSPRSHHEAVMVHVPILAVDENHFSVLQLTNCVIWSNTYVLYKYIGNCIYIVFHGGFCFTNGYSKI